MLQQLIVAAIAFLGALGVFLLIVFVPERTEEETPRWAAQGGGIRDRLYQPLSALTERVAWSRPRGRSLSEQLALSGLTMTASEFLALQTVTAIVLAGLGLLRFGLGWEFLALALIGYLVPAVYLRIRRAQRKSAFQSQIADALTMLASALRAGYSFPQALDSVAKTAPPPLGEEFSRVVREIGVGSSPAQALSNMVRRVESEDLELAVVAVVIHSTVGGNLAKILDNITHTVRERIRVMGEIRSLTAQARASGAALTLLPIALAVILYLIAPGYFQSITSQSLGWLMLGYCAVSILIGNLIFRRIARIDVR